VLNDDSVKFAGDGSKGRFGDNRNVMGEAKMLCQRVLQMDVLQEETCIERMRQFIANQPTPWNEDIGI
jgi:cytosine deaminase